MPRSVSLHCQILICIHMFLIFFELPYDFLFNVYPELKREIRLYIETFFRVSDDVCGPVAQLDRAVAF